MTRAGKLDRRIRIEAATLVDNGYGTVEQWAPFATVWAQYIPSAGKEAREQMGEAATLPATFVIRWSSKTAQITPGKHRVRFPNADDGQVYDIKSAAEVKRREEIHLTALARIGDGA